MKVEGVNFMLQISRKYFALPFHHVYFQDKKYDSRFDPKLIRYTHLLKPTRQLQGQKTVHIHLQKEENIIEFAVYPFPKRNTGDTRKSWNVVIVDKVMIKKFTISYNFTTQIGKGTNGEN